MDLVVFNGIRAPVPHDRNHDIKVSWSKGIIRLGCPKTARRTQLNVMDHQLHILIPASLILTTVGAIAQTFVPAPL